jgi:hypothetical protein
MIFMLWWKKDNQIFDEYQTVTKDHADKKN